LTRRLNRRLGVSLISILAEGFGMKVLFSRRIIFSVSLSALALLCVCLPLAAQNDPLLKPSTAPSPTPPPATMTDDTTVLIKTDEVNFTVTVTDPYNRYVSGLSQKHFRIYEDNVEQDILSFRDDDAPVSVGVIFDVSGSMSGDKIRRARVALSKFIETSHDSDEYFLIGFNSRAQLLMDRTRDGDAIINKLTFVQPKDNTALYDACYLGVEKVTRGTHKKRAILVISDGQDNNSRYTFKDLRRIVKESDVVMYAVGIVGGQGDLDFTGQAILEELAGVSGGKAFFPTTSADMDDIFERIALELRNQYAISYKPKNFVPDGRWHKIKVKITPPRGMPHLTARYKEGYFALANPR
jgi:Ca-activated chloride channel family protein